MLPQPQQFLGGAGSTGGNGRGTVIWNSANTRHNTAGQPLPSNAPPRYTLTNIRNDDVTRLMSQKQYDAWMPKQGFLQSMAGLLYHSKNKC